MQSPAIRGIEYVPEVGTIGYLEERLDVAAITFAAAGYEILSARDLAVARQFKQGVGMMAQSAHIREAIVFFPDQEPVLTKESPLLADVALAARAHDRSEEHYLNPDQSAVIKEIVSTDATLPIEHRRAFEVGTAGREKSIEITAFADEPLTRFLFGDKARSYAEYLWHTNRIPGMSFHFQRPYASGSSRPFVCQGALTYRAAFTTYPHSIVCSQLVWAKKQKREATSGSSRRILAV